MEMNCFIHIGKNIMDLILNIFYLVSVILGTLLLYKIKGGSTISYSIICFCIAILLTVAFIGDISTEKIPKKNFATRET